MLVLAVDDDKDDLDLFCEAVKEIDPAIHLISALNGEEALHYLLQKAVTCPDYIFLDINMPKMDGRACLAAIRQHKLTKNIAVIMYSTSLSNEDMVLFDRLNARFLTKASSYTGLVASLKQILTTMKAESAAPVSLQPH